MSSPDSSYGYFNIPASANIMSVTSSYDSKYVLYVDNYLNVWLNNDFSIDNSNNFFTITSPYLDSSGLDSYMIDLSMSIPVLFWQNPSHCYILRDVSEQYIAVLCINMNNIDNVSTHTGIWYSNITNVNSTSTNIIWNNLSSSQTLVAANVFGNNTGLIGLSSGIYYYYNNFVLESSYNSTIYSYPPYNYTSTEINNSGNQYVFNENYMLLPITYIYTDNSNTSIYYYQGNIYIWDLSNCNLSNSNVHLLYDSSYLLQQYYSTSLSGELSEMSNYNSFFFQNTYISQDNSNITLISSNIDNCISCIFYSNNFNYSPGLSNEDIPFNIITTVTPPPDISFGYTTPYIPPIYNTCFHDFTISNDSTQQLISYYYGGNPPIPDVCGNYLNTLYYSNNSSNSYSIIPELYYLGLSNESFSNYYVQLGVMSPCISTDTSNNYYAFFGILTSLFIATTASFTPINPLPPLIQYPSTTNTTTIAQTTISSSANINANTKNIIGITSSYDNKYVLYVDNKLNFYLDSNNLSNKNATNFTNILSPYQNISNINLPVQLDNITLQNMYIIVDGNNYIAIVFYCIDNINLGVYYAIISQKINSWTQITITDKTTSDIFLVGANIFGNTSSIMLYAGEYYYFTYTVSSFIQKYVYLMPSYVSQIQGYAYSRYNINNIYNSDVYVSTVNTNLSITMNNDYAIVPFTSLYNYIYDVTITYSETNLYICNLNNGDINLLYNSNYILDTYLNELGMTDFSYNTFNFISTFISQDNNNITIVSTNINNNISGIFYNNKFNYISGLSNEDLSINIVSSVEISSELSQYTSIIPQIYNTPFSLFTTGNNLQNQIITTYSSNNSSGNINNIVYYTNNNCNTFTISSNLYNAGVSNNMSGTTYNINSISPITIDSYIYITANELIYYYYN